MKPLKLLFALAAMLGFSALLQSQNVPGTYKIIVEGFDWGPAVNKVVLDMGENLSEVPGGSFTVYASRSTDLAEIPPPMASGERQVLSTYISDSNGKRSASGNHLTLVLSVGPRMPLTSPFQYANNERVRGNFWVDYQVVVTHVPSLRTWNRKTGRIMPLVDRFDLTGKFEYAPGNSLSYASFKPASGNDKKPLIIWLHGGGEGGTDPTVALLGNRAANYASDEIQQIFGGAFVLVPQSPTRWMEDGNGETTRGGTDDRFHEGLMDLIEDFVAKNPQVDQDRIYVGGCSNGGYMSMKLILEHPGYFAAGYISALAYFNEFVTDPQIRSIRRLPIWFMHAKDDPVTVPENTVVPIYQRLIAAGARDVHFSYYDHVTDITGQYGGEDFRYSGHWSWIYSHANEARTDYDGGPVLVDGIPVTVMQWMAAQQK